MSRFFSMCDNSFFSIFHSSALSTPAFATCFALFFFILRFLPLFSLFVINYIDPLPSLARRCERKCLHRLHEKTLCSGVRFFPLTATFQFPNCTSFFPSPLYGWFAKASCVRSETRGAETGFHSSLHPLDSKGAHIFAVLSFLSFFPIFTRSTQYT